MAAPAFWDGLQCWADNNDYAAFGWDGNFNGLTNLTLPNGSTGRVSQVTYSEAGITDPAIDGQDYSTLYVGFWMRPAGTAAEGNLLYFHDTDAPGSLHLAIKFLADGTLEARRGGYTGTLVASSSQKINNTLGVWNHIQIKVVFSNTVGSVEFRINGVTESATTSIDTCNNANEYCNYVRIYRAGGTWYGYCFWVDNTQFWGELQALGVDPDADGNQTDFSPSSGIDNYAMVDEGYNPDDDSTYNESSTVSDLDLYQFDVAGVLPASLDIYSARHAAYLKKTDVGAKQIRMACRSGGTNYYKAAEAALASYASHLERRDVDPNTSAAWTRANLDSAEWGIEHNS